MKGWMVLGDFNGPWVETVDLKQQDGFFPPHGDNTPTKSGWWFGTWLLFFHRLGMSSSQLTFIFFRG